MEHCKSEQEVRDWAKTNGYNGSGIDAVVAKWKVAKEAPAKVSVASDDDDED
jgi:hypothetical protein